MEDQIVTLNLSIKNVNTVLHHLGLGQYSSVFELIEDIRQQGAKEIQRIKTESAQKEASVDSKASNA